jgi:hypothetical protein
MEPFVEESVLRAQEAIARCAYLIWESEGRPIGRALEHWLQAEDRLLAAGRIVVVPDSAPLPGDAAAKPLFQRYRYGLVLKQQQTV